MKKLILITACIFTVALKSSVAGNKPMVSNGLFVDMGFGFPNPPGYPGIDYSRGTSITFDIGNKFIFYKTLEDQLGIGMNATWITLGFGSSEGYGSFYIKPMRIGPNGTYAFNDEMAIDAFLDFMPTFVFNGTFDSGDDVYVDHGVLIVPGARFRYKVFSAGFEVAAGSLNKDNLDDESDYGSSSIVEPRITLGFKF